MKREYHKWYSSNLNRDMELLVFGHKGTKVLFFPPRMGRFYDYENWRVISKLRSKIEAGYLQVFCVDSVDTESFYNFFSHPEYKIWRHVQYQEYILKEVMPLMSLLNNDSPTIVAGCSLGAYHAVNLAFKYPHLFCKVVGMSGRYDLTVGINHYSDLLSGYHDENVYFNMPTQYLQNINDNNYLNQIRKLDIVLVAGKCDCILNSNHKLSNILNQKGISHRMFEWNEEAHRAYYWRRMVPLYI